MASLITLAFLTLIIFGTKRKWDGDGIFGLWCLFVVCFLIDLLFVGLIINGRTINSKIVMYEEENQRIETELNVLVEQYMNYEANAYGNLKGESSITLVSLYPELKADTLVEKQIEVYTSNNSKIRELKEKLINISNYKWWLYFGK